MASSDSRGRRGRSRINRASRRRLRRGARAGRRRNLAGRARGVLRAFRRASVLAVAMTAMLLLVLAPSHAAEEENEAVASETVASETTAGGATEVGETGVEETGSATDAAEEAVGAVRAVWDGLYRNLPRFAVALVLIAVAWALARCVKWIILRLTRGWQRSQAASALAGIAVWLVAIGFAASALAGDLRALVGSLGLIGLALSWALQTPIESFTGWLLTSFQGYYRVGDRVAVGEVFGDVVKIDFLTTTVWEIGGPHRAGFVAAEQPTGRMVTFPNNEILAGSVVNLTRDFPYLWDELAVPVGNESDLRYAMGVLQRLADDLFVTAMREPARQYGAILRTAGLAEQVPDRPQIFASPAESWTDLTIRYLVGARERRRWKIELVLRVSDELARPEVAAKVLPAYPRRQLQRIDEGGVPQSWKDAPDSA